MSPITEELKSVSKLEAAGFTTQQARAIVEVQEDGFARGFERFAGILDQKLTELRLELRGEFRSGVDSLRFEFHRELRLQLFWFASIQTAIIVAVAALFKLFI